MPARPSMLRWLLATAVTVAGIVLLTRTSTELDEIQSLPPGLYILERSAEPAMYIWLESVDHYYAETSDGTEFVNHTLLEGGVLTSWTSGNIIDPSRLDLDGRAATSRELDALGFGTVPTAVDVSSDPLSVPDGVLIPPGLLSDEFELDGLTMFRESERILFTENGVPVSATFTTTNGDVVTTTVSFSPGVEIGVVELGCTARSPEALAIQVGYPTTQC